MRKVIAISMTGLVLVGSAGMALGEAEGERPRRERSQTEVREDAERPQRGEGRRRGGVEGERPGDGERRGPRVDPEKRRAEMLERFDADKDGQLNDDERGQAFDSIMQERPRMAERMLERFDQDGDGKLSDEERKEALAAWQERRGRGGEAGGGGVEGERGGPMRQELIERFDADKDGKLSDEERAAARSEMETRRAEMLQRFDKDGDGKLSGEERQAAREARRHRKETKGL